MVHQHGGSPVPVSIEPAEDMIRRELGTKAQSDLTRSSGRRGEHWRQSQAAREPFCPRLAPGDNQSRLLPSARLISNRNNRLSPRGDQVDRANAKVVL